MINLANRTNSTRILFMQLLLIGLAIGKGNAEECFIAAPYVLHATHNSAQVIWVTPAGIDAGKVYVEDADGVVQQSVVAELSTPLFHDITADNGVLDHSRHLAKLQNLEPHSRYYYTVYCGDGETTSNGTFLTAPLPGESLPFEFVVVADGHASDSYLNISEPVGKLKPSFVIHAGDLRGGTGAYWDRWETYFRVARPYLESSVFVPVVGGHDVRPARNFRSLFAFNDPEGNPSDENSVGTYYSFEFGNMLVILLDHVYDFGKQREWVEEVLSESDAEWIIVSLHESPANAGGRGYWLHNDFYEELAHLFEKYGVDLVITGHDHIYERNIPLGSEGVKPVHYITINSNGNHRRVRPSPIVHGGIGKNAHVFTHFRVDGNHLEMEAIRADGSVVDHLELVKDEYGMYQEEVMNQAIDLDLAGKLAHIYTGHSVATDLRYQRSDINGSFYPSVPEAGQETVIRLNTGHSGDSDRDISRFPIGSELIVYEQSDPSGWQTKKQIIPVTGNTVNVKLLAPEALIYDEDGFNIRPKLNLNIRVNGRKFDSVTVWPTLVEATEVEKVELVAPSNYETVSSRPLLDWEVVLLASEYQLQVGNPDLDEIILDTTLTEPRYTFSDDLSEGNFYTWRVRAKNAYDGLWSEESVFYVYQNVDEDNIEEVYYSMNLKPAAFGLDLPEVTTGSFGAGFRGRHNLFTWFGEEDTLYLDVRGGDISHFRDRGNVQFSVFSYHEDPPVKVDEDDTVPPDGETYTIRLESPFYGLHKLEWNDGNDRTRLGWSEDQPMTALASKENPFSFQRNMVLYFYVPKETQFVGGFVSNHSRARFFDGSGKELLGWQDKQEGRGYFNIPVPRGQDGKLWRISSNLEQTLRLMTVPPYLALNERQLLLPVEVLNYSETKSPEPIGDRILINGDFSDGLESWTSFTAEYASVSADITVLGGEAAITNIAGAVGEVSHVQFNQELTAGQIKALEVGSNYIIKFDARSDVDGRQLRLFFGEAGGDFTPLNITDLELSSDMETYEAVFEVDQTFGSMKLGFEMGHSNDDVIIDNVSLAQTDKNLPTSADHEMFDVPMAFQLRQNYPNPFNPTTQIQFDIPEQSEVTLELFTVMGQRVATLASGEYHPGQHTVEFDATNLASGMYIYRLQAGSFTQTKKMMLIK